MMEPRKFASTSIKINYQRPTNHHFQPFLVLFAFLLSSHLIIDSIIVANGAITRRKFCKTSDDCDLDQCCVETPSGHKICLNYEQQGDICFFRFRTPTCGCSPGLKCVSTSPMQPGDWNHDYVCARVRPFQYHKLMPYFDDDTNDVQYP